MWSDAVTRTDTVPPIAVPTVFQVLTETDTAPVGPLAAMADMVEQIAAMTVRHGNVVRRLPPVERGAAVWRVGAIYAAPSIADDRSVSVTWYDTADTARTVVRPMTRVGLFGR